jgi:cobalt-zinc-cadmium efflux system membrane fusion protein
MHEGWLSRRFAPGGGRFTTLAVALALTAGLAGGGALVWALVRPPAPAEEEARDPALPPGVVELPEAAQRNAGVEILPVRSATLPVAIEVTGAVAPDEARVAHIRPLARGLIEDVSVRLGERVAAGQPLVVYDNIALGELIGEFLSERAALRQAETDRDVRERVLERAEELIKLEAIAQQALDLRRAEFQNAKAAVDSQKARVARVEEQIHRFGLSEDDLGKLTSEEGENPHRTASHNSIRAPFDGIITKYDVAAGELVEPERELFVLTNLSVVWVLADVYEKDLARVQAGADVSIVVDAYPDRTFVGRVTYVSDLIDPKTRTAKLRCVVQNPDGALKLDMFARVRIPTRESRTVVVVPARAVQQVDGRPVVFVSRTATQFERREVQVGSTAGDLVEVIGGVRPGEKVVGHGSFYLKSALLRERAGEEQ